MTKLVLFSSIIILFCAVSLIAANSVFMITDQVYEGVYVGDISVGGLSKEGAKEKIAGYLKRNMNEPIIVLTYQNRSWPILPADIDLVIDVDRLAHKAYSVGREGNIFFRLQERFLTINRGHEIPLAMEYNQEKMNNVLETISGLLDSEAQNAMLVLENAAIKVVPEVVGYKVDIAETLHIVNNKLVKGVPFKAELVVAESHPKVLAADIAGIDAVIATFTTHFDPSNRNRVQNIMLGARNFNNIVVKNNEVVSFNDIVGPRLEKYGFKEAPAFIDGKLVPDWGGGICQVTSTLYNAVLLADLTIEERTSHCRPPGYVPLGQDATVADNLLDFKFKNTAGHNIYIKSEVSDSAVTVYILGKGGNRPEIKVFSTDKKIIEPETIVTQDDTLEVGKEVIETEGQRGFFVKTWRVKKLNGEELSRELLANDEYMPENRVVRIGTKVLPKQPPMK